MLVPISKRGSMIEFFGGRNDILLAYQGYNRLDFSRFGNNLVSVAKESYTPREGNSAWDFTGSDKAITTSAITFNSNKITVLAWINPKEYGDVGASGRIFGTWDGVAIDCFGFNEALTTPKLLTAFIIGTTGLLNQGYPLIPQGKETLVAVLFDNSTATGNLKVSYDGVEQPISLILSANKTGTSNFADRKVTLATNEGVAFPTKMAIGDFMIFRSDLFAEEGLIKQYYDWATSVDEDEKLKGGI